MRPSERELPMLVGIGSFIHWCEELASLLAGPVLTGGLGIALVDLFTDGKLLASTPMLLFVWAVSQTVGLDAQLVGSAARLGVALRRRDGRAAMGYALLVCALGYVAFQASNVFAMQQADGVTTAQALGRLGMDGATWIIERSALAVTLVILSGLLRYAAPAPSETSVDDERVRLERELALEPLRQRLRATQVGGLRTLAVTALQGTSVTKAEQASGTASLELEASERLPAPTLDGYEAAAQTSLAAAYSPAPMLPVTAAAPLIERQRNQPPDELDCTPTSVSLVASSPSAPGSNPGRSTGARNKVAQGKGVGSRPRQDRRSASRANARSGARGEAQQRVYAILSAEPGIEFESLVRAANVSRSTASKWREAWLVEQRATGAIDARQAAL